MGSIWDKSIVKKEDVELNISKINDLTKKFTLIEFIGLYLEFSLDEDIFFSNKIIKVIVKKYNSHEGKIEVKEKIVRLTIEEFYSYFNALMNSLSIFYESKLEERLKTLGEEDFDNLGIDESSLCPICEEKKVELSLPCSHFFCEDCIKKWVIKSETCPLCRFKLKHSNKEETETPAGIEGTNRWSIFINDENVKQEIKKDNIEIFLKLTNRFFSTQ
jgi:hypothetical protein